MSSGNIPTLLCGFALSLISFGSYIALWQHGWQAAVFGFVLAVSAFCRGFLAAQQETKHA